VTFLNAGLLWLTALAAVPIILHLLFRQRFKEVRWAPMRLLQLTVRRTRRRRRIEELLLLLLRVLVALLIALAVSRPALSEKLMGGLFGGDLERIIIVDDSLSMARPAGNTTALGGVRDVLASVLGDLSSGQRVTVLSATNPTEPLLDNVAVREDGIDALLASVEQTDATVDWRGTLGAVARRIKGLSGKQAEVLICSDGQALGWQAGVADELAALPGVKVRYLEAKPTAGADLAVIAFDRGSGVVAERGLVRWRAVVRNLGTVASEPLQATLKLDDEARSVNVPAIAAGADHEVVVRLRAPSAGMHEAAFELPPDANPRDNVRRQVLAVAAGADFVVVDGSLDGDGTVWLETALAVGNEGWRVARYSADEWTSGTPALGDVLILAGVEDIPRAHAESLAAAVKEGRLGLAYFPAEEAKVSGPLTTVLAGVPDAVVTGQQRGMNGPWPAASLAAGLSDVKEAALARVTAQRVMRYEPAPDAVAVGRWADTDLPVMWQRRVEDGMTAVWSVGATREWSDWPLEPSWLLALRSAMQGLLPETSGLCNVEAGGALIWRHPPKTPPEKLTDETGQAIAMTASGDNAVIVSSDTRRAGIRKYSVTTGSKIEPAWFAVSPSAAESTRSERLDESKLQAVMGPIPTSWAALDGGSVGDAGEIWVQAVVMLFGLILLEPGVTWWMARNRGSES
jgi:hypothetical protein